jgi:hypothetical protein
VACIGDGITEGSGLSNPSLESYPAKLGRLMGPNFQVRNFGVSGRTLLKRGDFTYWANAAYRQSRDYEPDVVVSWGANAADHVLRSRPTVGTTNVAWSVVEQVDCNDGATMRVANLLSGPQRFYRLWQP